MTNQPEVYPPMIAVVAYAKKNRVIGVDNQLPWHLPDDLKQFKLLTSNKAILMGRKTYLSIGKALPNRQNIILTRDAGFQASGCQVIHNLRELGALTLLSPEIYVIGGAEIYNLCLPHCHTIFATEVEVDVEGDTTFPHLIKDEWRVAERTEYPKTSLRELAFDRVRYSRTRAPSLSLLQNAPLSSS